MPVIWQSSCMILGASDPPFVWAGYRPRRDIHIEEVVAAKL